MRMRNELLIATLEKNINTMERAEIALAKLIVENAELRATVKELKGRLGIAK